MSFFFAFFPRRGGRTRRRRRMPLLPFPALPSLPLVGRWSRRRLHPGRRRLGRWPIPLQQLRFLQHAIDANRRPVNRRPMNQRPMNRFPVKRRSANRHPTNQSPVSRRHLDRRRAHRRHADRRRLCPGRGVIGPSLGRSLGRDSLPLKLKKKSEERFKTSHSICSR